MGRKSIGRGKQLYFCLTLLIFCSACSLVSESSRRQELRNLLGRGNSSLARGDYDASLKAFAQVQGMAQGQPPSDAAAYGMGLVYAHPQNPDGDRQKAIGCFNQVIVNYPASPWAEQAKIWVGVLSEAEKSRQEMERSRSLLEKTQREVKSSRLLVEETKLEVEKAQMELERTRQEIEKAKQIIEKSRQVDIEIEQKRRQRRK